LLDSGGREEDSIAVAGEEKVAAWKCLEPTHPMVARYYSLGGIEHLAGEA